MHRPYLLISTLALLFSSFALAQELPPNVKNADAPPDRLAQAMQTANMKMLGKGRYQLGNVSIDQKNKRISLRGHVNQVEGPIELIACATGGRTHESVLVLDVEPIHVQTALLLIGLRPGQNIQKEGDERVPEGSGVIVDVSWELRGQTQTFRAEDLAFNVTNKKTMPRTNWIFTGSQMVNGRFMAQEEKSIITTYRFPYTIIDNPLPSGTNDELYTANTLLLPPLGTPVEVVIRSAGTSSEDQK